MATKTAIAAKERAVKERIADKDRRENRRQFEKSHDLAKMRANYEGLDRSSNVVKNLSQAAFGKGGLASAMSENDPQWYKKFGLNSYSVNLPTFYRLGTQLHNKWLSESVTDVVPGIAVINFCPTLPNNFENASIPNKEYQHSPINQCLTRFMAELRKLNSRIGDYDPSDLGLYWYSVIGLMYRLGMLTKAIKFYNTYYAENRYFAKACIKSCGFNVSDFLEHVQEYKGRLMKWISIFNSNVVLPNSLDLLKRAFWISNVVVREHKTNCSQIYHFNNIFDMTLDDDEQYVKFTKKSGEYTFAVWTLNTESYIQSLFNSVGVVTMTADLRAAFPDSTLLKYPEFKGDETVIYSDSIHDLEQIHNLKTLPVNGSSFGFYGSDVNTATAATNLKNYDIIVDSDGYLVQGKVSGGNVKPFYYDDVQQNRDKLPIYTQGTDANFLNFYDSDYVSDDAILEATRLRFIINNYDETLGGMSIKYCGTEIPTDIVLVTAETMNESYPCIYIYTEVDNYTTTVLSPQEASALANASTFDWLPIIQFYASDDEDWRWTFGEIDHAVYLANANLRVIHEGCAFSLFYVTDFGKAHVA